MSQISNYLENNLINLTLRNVAYTPATTIYVALFLSDPTDAGTGTECSAASYARQTISFSASSNGTTANTNEILFSSATTDWGNITHAALYDASTGGNLLYYSPLTTSKSIAVGDIFRIAIGNLTVQLS